jgi:predicted RNase H-like nuclease
MKVTIIGIDCATNNNNVGLALASMSDSRPRVLETTTGRGIKSTDELASFIANCIPKTGPTLLALDAPLGWPARLGEMLAQHSAGAPLDVKANGLFRRYTDRFVKEKIGKQPLDVGADRIARTAHAALALLQAIGEQKGQSVPLAWSPDVQRGISAIEVYPAATLVAHEIRASGYKNRGQREERQEILAALAERLVLPEDTSLLMSNADALDAVVCVLAAADFLSGNTFSPLNKKLARKEGWIWVRDPERGQNNERNSPAHR